MRTSEIYSTVLYGTPSGQVSMEHHRNCLLSIILRPGPIYHMFSLVAQILNVACQGLKADAIELENI